MPAMQRLLSITIGLSTAIALTPTGALAQIAATDHDSELTRPLLVGHLLSGDISTLTATRQGGLTVLATGVPSGSGTRPIVVSPDGRFAFSAARAVNEIRSYAVATDGTLTPLFAVQGQDLLPFGIVLSPDGRTLYVCYQNADLLSAYAVGSDGSLIPRGPAQPSGAVHPRTMVMTPDGRFLFVSHGDSTLRQPGVIIGFAVAPDGTVAPHAGPYAIGTSGGAPIITPDGRFLYVPGEESNELHGFHIDDSGQLTPVPGSPYSVIGEHQGTAVTPDGRHLYVTDITGDLVRAYRIAADGALDPVPGSPFPAGDLPIGITPSPDGRFLYVSNFNSDNVSIYAITDTGALSQLSGSPAATGGTRPASRSVAFVPNQGPRANFVTLPQRFGQPSILDARTSADSDGRVARYDWDFGDGTLRRAAGPIAAHVYRRPGVYTVTLTVTDDEGCSTQLVYTGYIALCSGTPAATLTRQIVVR